jgi:divalent metal cation (Fe/Co/Zn/Cd) transporter
MEKRTLENIRRLAERDPGVAFVGTPLTMYFGPFSIFLALDVQFRDGLSAAEVTAAVDRIEKAIRSEYPKVQRIFIEAESIRTGRQASTSSAG